MSEPYSLRPSSEVFRKWGLHVSQIGYTTVPNTLVYANLYLKDKVRLTPTEFWILAVMLSCWRDDRLPQPSKKFIADRIGISERHVQRSIRSLEAKGFIRTNPFHDRNYRANEYFLDGVLRFVKYVWTLREMNKGLGRNVIPLVGNINSDTPEIDDHFKLKLNDDEDVPF